VIAMAKRVVLYQRVSTTEQTVENQQRELEAIARRHDWDVVAAPPISYRWFLATN
jgi:DNA invertase Pin-like site-specific DNA recombinase